MKVRIIDEGVAVEINEEDLVGMKEAFDFFNMTDQVTRKSNGEMKTYLKINEDNLPK